MLIPLSLSSFMRLRLPLMCGNVMTKLTASKIVSCQIILDVLFDAGVIPYSEFFFVQKES